MVPPLFQSPSRWGRCCFTALRSAAALRSGFSPLLDGDGVASVECTPEVGEIGRFSPLLDGDGVASHELAVLQVALDLFQSPSRWGRCGFDCAPAARSAWSTVSVPF